MSTPELTWTDALDLDIRGIAWKDAEREHPFDRLPTSIKGHIPDGTHWLGMQSAGVYVEFRTAAQSLEVRWQLDEQGRHGQDPYMSLCGQHGVDLYGRDHAGVWRWAGARDPAGELQAQAAMNKTRLDGVEREYRVYLPLMARVLKLEIGSDAPLLPAAKAVQPPVVYYGTSIVHGAGVTRPGIGHAQRLGRALDVELINLGFCGSAKCEVAMAELLAKQPARLLLVDPLPNNDPAGIRERMPEFLRILGEAHPEIPILIPEERLFGDHAFQPVRGESVCAKNRALAEVIMERRAAGQTQLHPIPMDDYYGLEGSTDSNHPNDLGADQLFRTLLPVAQRYL